MTSYKKFTIKLKRKWKQICQLSNNTLKPTAIQQKTISIVRLTLKKDNAELMMMPTSGKRIINLEEGQLYIVLSTNIIEITNHTFHYHIELNYELYSKILKEFDQKLDKRIQDQEQTRLGQLEVGLDSLIKLIT